MLLLHFCVNFMMKLMAIYSLDLNKYQKVCFVPAPLLTIPKLLVFISLVLDAPEYTPL
jgi:hypothetical protein